MWFFAKGLASASQWVSGREDHDADRLRARSERKNHFKSTGEGTFCEMAWQKGFLS